MSRIHHGGHGTYVSGQPPCAVAWTPLHFCDLDPGHTGKPHRCSCGATLTYVRTTPMKRLLTPSLNPAGLTAAANLLCAITMAILTRYHIHWGLSVSGLALVNAGVAWWNRTQVTPIADPRVPGKVITDLTPPALAAPAVSIRADATQALEQLARARATVADVTGPPGSTITYTTTTTPPDVHDQPQPPGA